MRCNDAIAYVLFGDLLMSGERAELAAGTLARLMLSRLGI